MGLCKVTFEPIPLEYLTDVVHTKAGQFHKVWLPHLNYLRPDSSAIILQGTSDLQQTISCNLQHIFVSLSRCCFFDWFICDWCILFLWKYRKFNLVVDNYSVYWIAVAALGWYGVWSWLSFSSFFSVGPVQTCDIMWRNTINKTLIKSWAISERSQDSLPLQQVSLYVPEWKPFIIPSL